MPVVDADPPVARRGGPSSAELAADRSSTARRRRVRTRARSSAAGCGGAVFVKRPVGEHAGAEAQRAAPPSAAVARIAVVSLELHGRAGLDERGRRAPRPSW